MVSSARQGCRRRSGRPHAVASSGRRTTTTAPRRRHTTCARERFGRARRSARSYSDDSLFAPNGCKPRLLLTRQPGRSVVMLELDETRLRHEAAPRLKRMEDAVAIALPAFFVVAARIRAHQYAV